MKKGFLEEVNLCFQEQLWAGNGGYKSGMRPEVWEVQESCIWYQEGIVPGQCLPWALLPAQFIPGLCLAICSLSTQAFFWPTVFIHGEQSPGLLCPGRELRVFAPGASGSSGQLRVFHCPLSQVLCHPVSIQGSSGTFSPHKLRSVTPLNSYCQTLANARFGL